MASLLAVWELTTDESLLWEAYEKAPTNLLVGLNVFRSLPLSEDEQRDLVKRLQKAYPESVVGNVLAAGLAAKQDDKTEFRSLVGEMQRHPDLDLEITARSLARREALMSLGKSSLEARIIAYSRVVPIPTEQFMTVGRAGLAEVKRLVADGEVDGALELSGQLMALGQRLQQEPGHTPVADLTGFALQAAGIRGLPEDVEIGNTGRSPTEQIAFLRAQSTSPSDWNASLWHLKHFDEAGAELYFQIEEQRGDREALKWAETYNGPAPRTEPAAQ